VGVVEDRSVRDDADGGRRLEDAAPLLAVTSPGGDEILIPVCEGVSGGREYRSKRIEMTLPEGLIEINRSPGSGGASKDQKR